MTFREKIYHMRALADARRQTLRPYSSMEAALWEVKRDTYDTVIRLWDEEKDATNTPHKVIPHSS